MVLCCRLGTLNHSTRRCVGSVTVGLQCYCRFAVIIHLMRRAHDFCEQVSVMVTLLH